MTLKPVFAALAVLMLAVPAAQAAPAAVAATDYEAWSLRCEARPAAAAKTCGLTQTVTVKGPDGKDGVAMVVLLRQVGGSDKLQLSLNLPITVLLPDGVRLLDASDKEVLRLPFIACRPAGCEAGAVITAKQAEALATGEHAAAVYPLQTGKTVKLGFSLKGFAAGLKALKAS